MMSRRIMAGDQPLLDRVARVALAPAIPQPGESLPGSTPALSARPLTGTDAPADKPWAQLRPSLRASLCEGATAEVFAACAGGGVLTAWALHLGASPLAIGLLGALPVACNLLNLPAAWLSRAVGRKRLAVAAVGASRLVYLPLVAFPFLPLADATRLRLFIALVAVAAVLAVIGNNAWLAWMGDLLPASVRGRFFGRRTMFLTLAGATASLGAGLMLDALSPRGWKGETLAGLAAVATLAGLVSIWLLRRQHEPAPVSTHTVEGAWAAVAACLGDRAVRPFLWYQLAWHAAVACVAGFISFHMLVNLRMGFAMVAAHGVAVAVVRVVAAPLWGRAVDRLGARPVLVLCSFGVAAVPAIWMLPTPERLWPIALEALVSGVLWGGHGIASVDLSVALAPRGGRPFYLAAFATAGGLGFAAASILAGLLAAFLPAQFPLFGVSWTAIHVLLLISALARVAAALLAVRIQERNARGVPELLRTLARELPKTVTVRRLPVPKPWAVFQPPSRQAAARSRRRAPGSVPASRG
jgi:MFS family permease